MDRWVHGIGANWALQQLMDTGGWSDRCRTHNVVDIVGGGGVVVVGIVRL